MDPKAAKGGSMKRKFITRRRKSRSFNPGHEELAMAVNEFVKHGGQIKQIIATDSNLPEFLEHKDERAVDEFLMSTLP
ncbi:MAG: hypothetical protein A2600_11410 [Candidatus Lambdaproteobacteria bacterium RIFOXYD1_FULL_56_27]|uniref:Uncharacterized protein n=1 Tax=Candidatus Lambdaproteobacteria bacterium RIFOXYD2_FULL_56_26 TaxID=1817773 RepID=A0A1F6H0Q1_9PROT|nr:MAG: hypothetical protein A2426_12590 [Candidatus Lambdaproteobacteria bacterium RIFOXYC1_FULL_56_13]OGH03978.1 MAG: hypothetical protein A2557_11170 [Candidatus Lambdaproteobacteria bacterium RIFOXYD2_FULL_56_26]OGH08369.1 MAG: hypothetical protein A2600_11410 [Candidatus Lambdaproteobacteria bacterium RIFOXYD1_FULL_56_27]